MGKSSKKKFFVIDAMAMVFRNYYAFGQRPLTTSEGFPTSALFGSASFMMRLIEKEKPDYLLVASDTKSPTFRHELYPDYKANRTEMPEDLAQQIEPFFDLLDKMGCLLIKEEGVEADDLIASLVKQYASPDLHFYIVSGDKDFLQLVDENTSLYSPKKGGAVDIIGPDGVVEKFGCRPEQVIDFLALTGDSADNVPGVPGIGLKGAAKLLGEYENLETILANAHKIKNKRQNVALTEHKNLALLSQELVTLKHDLKTIDSLDSTVYPKERFILNEALENYFKKYELISLVNRLTLAKKDLGVEVHKVPQPIEKKQAAPDEKLSEEKSLDSGFKNCLVLEKKDFETLKQKFEEFNFFSFDSETTGLDGVSDKPIGLSFSFADKTSFYLPVEEEKLTKDLTLQEIIPFLKRIFSDPTKVKVCHNLKFDRAMLENMDLKIVTPYEDTMLMSFILNPGVSHSLDNLSKNHLQIEKIKIKELLAKAGTKKMEEVPLEEISHYACEDSLCCLELFLLFKESLKREGLTHLYEEVEIPFAGVLSSMERKGVLLDTKHLKNLSDYLDETLESLKKEIHVLADEEFNIASPKQLGVILYEKLKLQEKLNVKIKKTKTGFSTDVSMLNLMSAEPIVEKLLDFRSLAKLKSTYADALPKQVSSVTGRVHTSFHQTGTETGRLSSSDPNLQNIPIRSPLGQKVREAFVAKEGYTLVSADYSQVELRIMAHFAREEVLKEAFEAHKDIHRITASKVFAVDEEAVTDLQRSQAKAINFGILYGMGPRRLSQTTGLSLSEAKKFIEGYFETFPKVKDFLKELEEKAEELGYAETLSGRRRYLPGLQSESVRDQVLARNMAINTPIQGSAADLIKTAMINLHKKLLSSTLRCDLLLQIHDELVFECHEEDLEKAEKVIREEMESAWKLYVPIVVQIASSSNWAGAHS